MVHGWIRGILWLEFGNKAAHLSNAKIVDTDAGDKTHLRPREDFGMRLHVGWGRKAVE